MPTILREQELYDITLGAAFLGSGGGGSHKDGLRLLDELKSLDRAEVTMLHSKEMGDDEWAVMVAEIGSPRAFAINCISLFLGIKMPLSKRLRVLW